jgi:uncharacterized membrane protein
MATAEDGTGSMRRVAVAGLALGFGLGGFFDGILLHQILQWHHLLSGIDSAALSIANQILADGLFHLVMYAVTLAGLVLLWCHRQRWSTPAGGATVLTAALIGFGLWHVVDAVLSHWLLGLHRIRMDTDVPLLWDLGWLVLFGLIPLAAGLVLRRRRWSASGLGATPLLIAGLAVAAGALSAVPLRDNGGVVTVLFPSGTAQHEILDLIGRTNAQIVWVDDSQQVWSIRLPEAADRMALYAGGAFLVSNTFLPPGCFDWTAAEA